MLNRNCFRAVLCAALLRLFAATTAPAADAANPQTNPAKKTAAIPWDQVGAKAGADYHGEGLSVAATGAGARLHCVFQRLEGEATGEGLWLVSTVTNRPDDRFRVVARAVGREIRSPKSEVRSQSGFAGTLALPGTGEVSMDGQTVQFTRAGLVEEYSVSMDGVRQDFVVTEKPAGDGPLKVQLAVSGARVEAAAHGAQLVLEPSGRRIAYSRLRATDATGKDLPARIEVPKPSAFALSVVVDDAGAVYPVRIDPTFSDANWISMGGIPGVDDYVFAAVVDGSGNLYIGGQFTVADNTIANHIAKWNGSSWSALDSGMNGNVAALAVSGSDLYAGGYFTNAGGTAANYIAKWDGNSWSALGSGMGGAFIGTAPYVAALAVLGGTLYAGGDFTTAGGTAANYIAKWDGNNWSALGAGTARGGWDAEVLALAVSGSDLYVGGYFETAGGVSANSIAKWDGSSWSALGSGVTDSRKVTALAVSGSDLYVGGNFSAAGGGSANHIAKWDGSSWLALGSGLGGSGLNGGVNTLAVLGSDLYAGGGFASHIAKWNGGSWTAVPSATGGIAVWALAVLGRDLYVGGLFGPAGDTGAKGIAKWDGTSWAAVSSGLDNDVYALAASGSDLYAGGTFTSAGGSRANYIAQWNGSRWLPLGLGIGGINSNFRVSLPLTALAVSGTNLYAGGHFATAGVIAANNIAKWDGSSWLALGSGVGGTVYVLAVSGTNLYAGGSFGTAGGRVAYQIAKWDGSSWSALGGGIDFGADGVRALAVSGSDLYAGSTGGGGGGGGGGMLSVLGKWDGSSWSALGSGLNGGVNALAALGSDLYVGGSFTTAGAVAAMNIAKWDGSSWSALGSGVNSSVDALAVSGSDLYAGGYFTSAGGNGADYIAKWDGSSWSALGSGLNSRVYALAVSGNTLYAGGHFTIAGAKESEYVARASLLTLPTVSVLPSGASIVFTWPTNASGFTLQSTTSLVSPVVWTTNTPAPVVVNGQKKVSIPIFGTQQYFRLSK